MTMTMQERRERLRRRTQESSNDRGQRGLGRSLKVPLNLDIVDGTIVWYELKTDPRVSNMIDIIPFMVSNPRYQNMRQYTGKPTGMMPGDWDYKLEIPVHKKVGGSDASVLCIREAFGEHCPICDDMFEEYAKKGTTEFNKDLAASLQPQWRCVYKVYDYRDEKHTGFKLWDMAYKSFEEYLMEKAQTSEDGLVIFSDTEDGRVLEIEGRMKKIGDNDWVEPVSVRFLKRQEPYTEADVLVYPLDAMLIIPTHQDVCDIYYRMGGEDGQCQPQQKPQEEKAERTIPSRRMPAENRQPEKPRDECPAGGVLGIDLYKFEYCQNECPDAIFQKCSTEHDQVENAAQGQNEQTSPEQNQQETPSRRAPVTENNGVSSPPVRRSPPSGSSTAETSSSAPVRRRR